MSYEEYKAIIRDVIFELGSATMQTSVALSPYSLSSVDLATNRTATALEKLKLARKYYDSNS